MKLRSLTIQNFRSITKAYKLPLASTTVLIGPNNEGKSNVLRALVFATRILLRSRGGVVYAATRRNRELDYHWERDFPVHLREKTPNGESVFVLEYELSEDETEHFRSEIGSKLNGTLPIRIAIGANRTPKITVHKKGPGAKVISAKAAKIASFVADRIDLEYIPAVRTAESALHVVDTMVDRELSTLEEHPEYVEALQRIADIQRPVLQTLSESIKSTLVQFLPAVEGVDLRVATAHRFEALRRCEIYIDDGTMTELRYKGDGVQSLAALGLMRHASGRAAQGKHVTVAIEEPESHLHPRAIHELREVVQQLGKKHQVVLTTHCPLFVSRATIESNILVNNGRAKPARDIAQIREILGVRAADNLQHAELVLVVEGEDDRIAVSSLLRTLSPLLQSALDANRLTIDTLAGASNLSYKLGLLRDALCGYQCLVDDDDAGRTAFERARSEGLLIDADVTLTRCQGMADAEFEDLLKEDLLDEVLRSKYRIGTAVVPRSARRKKWSERMKVVFTSAGKPWDDRVKAELKLAVAHAVASSPASALSPHRRTVVDSLVQALEERLRGSDPLTA